MSGPRVMGLNEFVHRGRSSMTDATIFVDESGDPGLTAATSIASNPYYVVGYVYVTDPKELRIRLRRFLRKAHRRGWYPEKLRELKFYLPKRWLHANGLPHEQVDSEYMPHLDSVRTRALHIIADHVDGVFAAVLDKRKALPTWTSVRVGNYVFAQSLVVDVLNVLAPSECPNVLYDKGRLSGTNSADFRRYINRKDSWLSGRKVKKYGGAIPPPIETSSLAEPGIWAADLVAGAYYIRYQQGDRRFSNILTKRRIGSGERLYWP
jgi:hypothetical protein